MIVAVVWMLNPVVGQHDLHLCISEVDVVLHAEVQRSPTRNASVEPTVSPGEGNCPGLWVLNLIAKKRARSGSPDIGTAF